MIKLRSGKPWLQRNSAGWALGSLSVLFFGVWLTGKLMQWPWPDGSGWQAIWTFFISLVAAIAAPIALAQLSAHHEAQIEQSRPYVIVDFSFRSILMSIEVKNTGKTPAKDIYLTWDVEPRPIGAHDNQVLKRNLVDEMIPFLAPGRSIRYNIGRAPDYWKANTLPKRFEVGASYTDTRGTEFGSGEQMVLDLAQWADARADVDYENKNWNQFKRQTDAQRTIAKGISNIEKHLNNLLETLVVPSSKLITSRSNESIAGVAWKILLGGCAKRRITKVRATTAENVASTDVTNEVGRSGFYLQDDDPPRDVAVNESINAYVLKSLADPQVSQIRISWIESGETFESTYSVS